jgi:hypothetical protein
VIDHALAHHLGRVRREDRHDQGAIEKKRRAIDADTGRGQPLQCVRDVVGGVVRRALTIFGQIRQHREQHEAADECERVVEAEGVEAPIDRRRAGDTAIAIDRGRADVLDALEQPVPAVRADDVTE